MNPMATDPLAELRDIHLPNAVGMWPPAPGWWILAALAIVAITYLIYRLYQRRLQAKFWVTASQELQKQIANAELTGQIALHACNDILKRAAIHGYPNQSIAELSGNSWLEWLVKHNFNFAQRDQLLTQWYQNDTDPQLVNAFQQASLVWLKQQARRWRRV